MILDDCALAVRDGLVCAVGSVGGRPTQDKTRIYANDTQYLREFSITADSSSDIPSTNHCSSEVTTNG